MSIVKTFFVDSIKSLLEHVGKMRVISNMLEPYVFLFSTFANIFHSH